MRAENPEEGRRDTEPPSSSMAAAGARSPIEMSFPLSSSLARLVMSSKTFTSSRYERTPAPSGQDLVATSTGLYCNTAVIPVFSILSLGVIPTIFQDEHCRGMLLRQAAGRPKTEGVQI